MSAGKPTQRVQWVDLARGFAILLVVFGHVWRGADMAELIPEEELFRRLDAAVYIFHMPFFFFLSGLFFSEVIWRRGLIQSLGPRIVTLLYPLVLWTYVLSLALVIAGSAANRPMQLSAFPIIPLPPWSLFWFLWALFLIQTAASPLIAAPINTTARLTLGIVLATVCWITYPLLPEGDQWLRPALKHLPYFLLGIGFGRVVFRPRPWMVAAAFAVFLMVVLNATHLMSAVPSRLAAGTVCVVCAAFCIMWVERRSNGAGPAAALCFIGQRSMAVYVSHILFTAGTRILLLKAGVSGLLLHAALGTACGVIGPLVLYAGAKHFRLRRFAGF